MTGVIELTEGHTLKSYDVDLAGLRMKLLEMGGLALDQVQRAVTALGTGDETTARLVVARESQVNNYDLDIDEECIALIARRQPVGGDLRVIISIVRAVSDLERVGDEAKKIARFVLGEGGPSGRRLSIGVARDARHMARLAVAMLRDSLDALDRMDPAVAVEVVQRDSEVNAEFHAALRRLVTVVMEDPRKVRNAIDAVFILKALERVGDHAKNIARHVVYLVQGRDVRHEDAVNLSSEAAR